MGMEQTFSALEVGTWPYGREVLEYRLAHIRVDVALNGVLAAKPRELFSHLDVEKLGDLLVR